ncbi:MAG: hypothetical protein V3V10_02685 [Planctomycetota bacterium]
MVMVSLLLGAASRTSLRASLRGSVPSVVVNTSVPELTAAQRIYALESAGSVVLLTGAAIIPSQLRSAKNLTITTGAEKTPGALRNSFNVILPNGAVQIQRQIYQSHVLGGNTPPSV